jgi:cytoskeletal protein RodZ
MQPNDEHNDAPVQQPDFEGEEMRMPENSDPIKNESDSIVNGPILLALGVLLVLLLGGMYYWFNVMNQSPAPTPAPAAERPTAEENNEPESTTAEAQAETMQTTSTSDEVSAIEADLEATDLESLDAELNAIDAELDAALNE